MNCDGDKALYEVEGGQVCRVMRLDPDAAEEMTRTLRPLNQTDERTAKGKVIIVKKFDGFDPRIMNRPPQRGRFF